MTDEKIDVDDDQEDPAAPLEGEDVGDGADADDADAADDDES